MSKPIDITKPCTTRDGSVMLPWCEHCNGAGWLAGAERDAARYRWLRLALSDQTSKGKSHWFCSITRGRPDELDAAIDAAREQEDKT